MARGVPISQGATVVQATLLRPKLKDGFSSKLTDTHDDPSSSPMVPRAALPAGTCRRAHRLRGPIGRVGHRRHTTSAPIHTFLLDCGAAGIPTGVSRIWCAWPRRQSAELVRHRAVAAYATCGRGCTLRGPSYCLP